MTSTATATLQITVNGQPRPLHGDMFVSGLIEQLKLDPRKVAIEHNLAIVPRSAYETTRLRSGDAIEIVGFIGGG